VTATELKLGYQDAALPQDACESGSIMGFGKVSRPMVTTAGKPFVSGVAPTGRTVAAVGQHAEVYASPIVDWQPAVGATTYQVELSRTLYPWHVTKRACDDVVAIVRIKITGDQSRSSSNEAFARGR
jgi:hypothetical protein